MKLWGRFYGDDVRGCVDAWMRGCVDAIEIEARGCDKPVDAIAVLKSW